MNKQPNKVKTFLKLFMTSCTDFSGTENIKNLYTHKLEMSVCIEEESKQYSNIVH